MKRQPKDPFNGAGHFKPRKPRKAAANPPQSRKPKPLLLSAEVKAILADIRQSAEAARTRLSMNNPRMVVADFDWIIELANDGLRVS